MPGNKQATGINLVVPDYIMKNTMVISSWEAEGRYDIHIVVKYPQLEKAFSIACIHGRHIPLKNQIPLLAEDHNPIDTAAFFRSSLISSFLPVLSSYSSS